MVGTFKLLNMFLKITEIRSQAVLTAEVGGVGEGEDAEQGERKVIRVVAEVVLLDKELVVDEAFAGEAALAVVLKVNADTGAECDRFNLLGG